MNDFSSDEMQGEQGRLEQERLEAEQSAHRKKTGPDGLMTASAQVASFGATTSGATASGMKDWVRELPALNRGLLFSGAFLIVFAVLRAGVPPLASAAGDAVHPYTAAGRQETCLAHLQAVGSALALYRQDFDTRFPPMDYTNGKAKNSDLSRVTWVSLLQSRTGAENFSCPLKSVSDTQHLSGYGFNPVLAATATGSGSSLNSVGESDLTKAESTLVLADRGDAHDVALLPPLATWRSGKSPSGAVAASDACGDDKCNLDVRHSDGVALLFADGHASTLSQGSGTTESELWGGSLLFRQAAGRVRAQHPILVQVQTALDKGDEATALKLLADKKQAARSGSKDVLALWKENQGADASEEVETAGWRLARLWRSVGEKAMLAELDRKESARSQTALQDVKSGAWAKYQSEWGFKLDFPAGWKATTEADGQYRNTTFQPPGNSHISLLIERGERNTAGPESGIDWSGMESSFKLKYGNRYKRIRTGETTLGGEQASLWEFEIEKKGESRQRKLYMGRSHRWNSFVFVATAPTADFEAWRPVFERMRQSFNTQQKRGTLQQGTL